MRAAASARGADTKYVTPAARRSRAQRDENTISERMIWDALDEGEDPTQDPHDQPQESATPPDPEARHDADTEGR
jgi:hypothetical protein